MKWSKPLMMDNDGGIDGCTGQLASHPTPCSPTVVDIILICEPPIIYYYV